jgi:hypothetical protein
LSSGSGGLEQRFLRVEDSVEVENLIVELRVGVLRVEISVSAPVVVRSGEGREEERPTHLKVHRPPTPTNQTLLPINAHHPRPVPTCLFVTHQPRLVEFRDEGADLEVELDGEGGGGERGLTVEVGAEEAGFGEKAGLWRRAGRSVSRRERRRRGDGRTLFSVMPSKRASCPQARQRTRKRSQSANRCASEICDWSVLNSRSGASRVDL